MENIVKHLVTNDKALLNVILSRMIGSTNYYFFNLKTSNK
jgi:hypothetical protein